MTRGPFVVTIALVADAKKEVDELRQEIGKLDAQIGGLIDKRARASKKIGELRKDQPPTMPLLDRTSLQSLVAASGTLPEHAMRSIVREIFAACVALELPVRVAYVGPEGGLGHAAAASRFGKSPGLFSAATVALSLDEVLRKRAEFAVVPLETFAEGPVLGTIADLVTRDLKIVEQLEVSFGLHLMNRTGRTEDIERIVATPQDRAACLTALTETFPNAQFSEAASPRAACDLASQNPQMAALCIESVGVESGLEISHRNVRDGVTQRTRYAVVGTRPSGRTGSDLTAIAFGVQDAPGALLSALKVFGERGINMTKIHSKPMVDGTWEYLFFVEVLGHFTDRAVVTAFEELKRQTKFFKVLGSYPAP